MACVLLWNTVIERIQTLKLPFYFSMFTLPDCLILSWEQNMDSLIDSSVTR